MKRNALLIGLAAVFVTLACVNIRFLAGFVGDERRYSSAAWEIVSGGPATNLEHPLLAKTIQGFFAALFVFLKLDPLIGMRLSSIAAGVGVLAGTYAIAARFVSRETAVVSAILLLSNSLFLVHSRLISPEMVSLCFLVFGIYYFLIDQLAFEPAALALAAAFFGLSMSAKWVGIWLIPWAILRLASAGEFGRAFKFLFVLMLFYAIGNGAYFLNHDLTDAVPWQRWALGYHRTAAEISAYNGSRAWTWFAVPQHLYYARLMPSANSAEAVLGTINPVVWILVVPALWMGIQKSRQHRAGLLLAEAAVCLYVPWMFVSRPTYFFYALTMLPVLCILEAMALTVAWEKRNALAKTVVVCAIALFALFYPAAVGLRISNGYERTLATFNFYKRPVFDSMFCQKCNLYAGESRNP